MRVIADVRIDHHLTLPGITDRGLSLRYYIHLYHGAVRANICNSNCRILPYFPRIFLIGNKLMERGRRPCSLINSSCSRASVRAHEGARPDQWCY